MKSKGKRIAKGCLIYVIGVIAIGVILGALFNNGSKPEEDISNLNYEQKAEKVYGEDLISFKEPVDNNIEITAKMGENFTEDFMVTGAANNFIDYLKLVKDDNPDFVKVTYKSTFVDNYGNESEETSMIVLVDNETLSKINFDNFYAENLEKVANSYFVDPALQ